jgi:Stress responsive A/B Barrel Domain
MTLLTNGRIRHSVVFTLNHAEGSAEEADFLDAVARLEALPGVEAFELMREVSPKNEYRFGLTMEFADPAAYSGYNEHPQHVDFVERRWDAEVSDFLEIDTVAI